MRRAFRTRIPRIGLVVGFTILLISRPAASETTHSDLLALTREIGASVERIRGLRFAQSVKVAIVDDATARSHFEQRAQKLWPADKIRHDEAALAQLGILPAGVEILPALLDVLEEQVGGYYDPEADAFYVLDDIPPDTAPILMAHELTHALDDQHFDIEALLERVEQTDDQSTALAAVLEGSGTLVQTLYMMAEMRAGRLPQDLLRRISESEAGQALKLRAAPEYLQRALIAPYVLGPGFVLRGDPTGIGSRDIAADLNRVFQDPPRSTEQILHPEKYWSTEHRDDPVPIVFPDLAASLGPGWSLASMGRLGELNLAILTGGKAPDSASPSASTPGAWTTPGAEGLAGDVFHHYTDGQHRVSVLATLWDSERDAQEFVEALDAMPGRYVYHALDRVVLVGGDTSRPTELAAAAMTGLRSEP